MQLMVPVISYFLNFIFILKKCRINDTFYMKSSVLIPLRHGTTKSLEKMGKENAFMRQVSIPLRHGTTKAYGTEEQLSYVNGINSS